MNRNFKNMLTITIAILAIGLVPLASGCASKSVFIPEAIQLEPGPIMITANQLYEEYMADEAAADAKYKGKELCITEATLDSYIESEKGNYLILRGYQFVKSRGGALGLGHIFTISTIELEPQIAKDFDLKDVGTGYLAEVMGECREVITEEDIPFFVEKNRVIPMVIIIEINQIVAITEEGAILGAPDYKGY